MENDSQGTEAPPLRKLRNKTIAISVDSSYTIVQSLKDGKRKKGSKASRSS